VKLGPKSTGPREDATPGSRQCAPDPVDAPTDATNWINAGLDRGVPGGSDDGENPHDPFITRIRPVYRDGPRRLRGRAPPAPGLSGPCLSRDHAGVNQARRDRYCVQREDRACD
jgi:hypothetical protein